MLSAANLRFRISSPVVLLLTVILCSLAGSILAPALAEEDGKIRSVLTEALILGPLPVPPPDAEAPPLRGNVVSVPEIDLMGRFPQIGQKVSLAPDQTTKWSKAKVDGQGSVRIPGGGVFWLATHLVVDGWTNLEIKVVGKGELTLYCDGQKEATRQSADADEELEVTVVAPRGPHVVLVRVQHPAGVKAMFHINLVATADPAVNISWSVTSRFAPFAFDRSREVATITNVTVAPQGQYIARRLTRRNRTGEESRSSVALLNAKGNLLATDVGGAEARPLAFTPDGNQLLLARSRDEGSDLVLWTLPAGPSHTIVRDEPDLGLVRMSPEGKYLLLSSSRGVEDEEAEESAARNRRHLREKVPDYTPHPHLHVVDITTGFRRRLTTPGDYVLDDAVFLPDGKRVVYGITVPREARPWFHTEIHSVDLYTGGDRIVATFVAGWEFRPQFFAPAPDSKRLAFLGPPAEVGGGQPEHNVYNTQVWLLDLESGDFERITRDLPLAFAGSRNLPGWDRKGNSMLTVVNQGSRRRLARLEEIRDGWSVDTFEIEGGSVGDAALSQESGFITFTASTLISPAALYLLDVTQGKDRLLEAVNSSLLDDWLISTPEDASFTGPGGESIEAWWYPPVVRIEESKIPLILYYYGGSVPTQRVFNTTHQFFAANGYAVLVINPRGAYGFGDEFADFHAGDWGPTASADILAGVDAFLTAHPEIDSDRIGIYGGSYGGFMTAYLVTATDRFAAAVSMYGISDLATYWGQGVWGWTYGDMALAGATPWSNPEEFVAKSPLFRADRIDTPLLLLHGLSDSNVTPGESEELFTALAMQNKMVELVLFPGEGHGISGSFANRVAHRTMMLEWFDRFLRDQPEAWEARWE